MKWQTHTECYILGVYSSMGSGVAFLFFKKKNVTFPCVKSTCPYKDYTNAKLKGLRFNPPVWYIWLSREKKEVHAASNGALPSAPSRREHIKVVSYRCTTHEFRLASDTPSNWHKNFLTGRKVSFSTFKV